MAFDWNASPSAPVSQGANNSTAAGVAAGVGETLLQHDLNERSAEKAFQRQQKLLRQEFDYNQKAQRNSVVNMRKSAEDAGLSPLALLGQGFSPAGASASGVSAASVSKPDLRPDRTTAQFDQMAAQTAVLQKQLDDIQAGIDLKNSQKDNVDEDTESKKLGNEQTRDANQAANENMREHLQGLKQLFESLGADASSIDAKIDDIDQGVRVYTQGAIRLNSEFEKYRKDLLENVPRYEQTNFDYKVAQLKKNNPQIAEAIASLPVSEQDKINAEITKIYADAFKAQTSAQLDAHKINEIETNVKALTQRMKSEYLRDPRLMLSDSDYAHFASWLGMDVYEKGMNTLQALIQMRSGQAGAQLLQDAKQSGAEKLEQMKQEGRPSTQTRTHYDMDKNGNVTGGYKEVIDNPSTQQGFHQKPARRKRRR